MNKFKTLKWTSLMMTIAIIITSCGGGDDAVPPPTADFSSAADADNYLTIKFTNSSTKATSYKWDFGDGATSTEQNPSHTYETANDYSVKLTAINAGGENAVTKVITIAPPAPTAAFTSGTDADDYLTINFSNGSEGATSYLWDFGDGTTSTDEEPSHTYDETGEYSVKLTATNASGDNSVTNSRIVKFQLTNPDLIGSGTKAWQIKPAAGAFGVGPDIGSDAWWPNGANISGDRPCLFNDNFIFKSGNVYEYDTNGDIWAEAYMGYSDTDKDKCQDESTLPEAAAAWGSGTFTYTFNPETDGSTPTIAVKGTGAFIALPKAKNGAEYASAPPTANAEVTYDVVSYKNDESGEELAITINYGGGYWNFILVPVVD